MKIIRALNLAYKYSKNSNELSDENEEEYLDALKNVNFEIYKGEFVSILGHNGSGKSTLARQLNVLLKPTSGSLFVCDYDSAEDEYVFDIRQNVGMVFQNPDNQIVATVVEDDVAFGPENLGVLSAEIVKRVDNALDIVNMKSFKKNSPTKLSGGQKQRIAIAGIIAMKPACIVFDEATAMLDPIGRNDVLKTMLDLNKNEGITIIHITHFMDETVNADKIIVMNKGEIVETGKPADVFKNVAKLKSLKLEVPQMTELCYLLNEKGFDLPLDVLDVFSMSACFEKIFLANKNLDFTYYKENVVKNDAVSDDKNDKYLELSNVSYIYDKDTKFAKKVLDDVSLNIKKGEFLAIIGQTGSGKSTLMQLLNATLVPTMGNVLFHDIDINIDKTKLKAIRQRIGLVFQYPEYQLFETTVYDDIAFAPKNLGLSDDEINKRVLDAAKLVGIDESIFKKSPFELSGGQKRRVAIAGILAMKPEVLVLDEPTAGLDPSGKDEILDAINKLHKELGITVVLVSHSMEDVAKIADQIVVMNCGEIVLKGDCDEIFNSALEIEKIGLETTKINMLFRNLIDKNFPVPKNIFTVTDAVSYFETILKQVEK